MATGVTVKLNRCLPLFVSLKIYWWPGTCLPTHESWDRLPVPDMAHVYVSVLFFSWFGLTCHAHILHFYSHVFIASLFISALRIARKCCSRFHPFQSAISSLTLCLTPFSQHLLCQHFHYSDSHKTALSAFMLSDLRFYIMNSSSCIMIADCCVCRTELKRYL